MKKFIIFLAMIIALLYGVHVFTGGDSDGNTSDSSGILDLFKNPKAEEDAFDSSYTAFAYDQLSDEGKHAYQLILESLKKHETEVTVTAEDASTISDYYSAMMVDHPELFWVSGNTDVWTTEREDRFTVKSDYIVDAEQINGIQTQIDAAASAVIASIPTDASEYDKVKACYEYIILNNDYDLNSPNNQNIQSVFLNHVSVCAGYAKAFQYLLNKMGMTALYIECNANGEPHALNMVQIDGAYYYVDCTWGDPQYGLDSESYAQDICYDYLCLTTAEIVRTHSFTENPLTLPDASTRTYDYYIMNGYYYERYDDDTILNALYDSVRSQSSTASMKFSDWDSYAMAVKRIFTDDLIDSPARELMDDRGVTTYEYHYDTDDYLMIIRIYW